MPLPIYTNDALDNWKRYGGDQAVIDSYVAKAGSTANLTPAATTEAPAAPSTTGPSPVAPSIPSQNENLKQNPFAIATPSANTLGKWVNENKPEDPGAYKGDDPYSMHWGGSLIGGSETGIQQYHDWQGQKDMYNQALQKWQQEYSAWQKQKAAEEKMRMRVAPSAEPQGPQQPAQPQWGPASTQQQNLGQPAATQATNPYAVPGQRSTPPPGTGPVQKPDRSVGAVNQRYAGVL